MEESYGHQCCRKEGEIQTNPGVVAKRKIAVIENGLFSTYTMRDALMKRLLQEQYDVTVLTHTNKFQKHVEKSGIHVIHVGSGNVNPVKVAKYVYRMFKALRKLKPDVILTFSIRPAICGNLIARMLDIDVITNITGVGPLFTSKNIAYRIARSIYRTALRKTKMVFFQNGDDKELFLRHNFVTEARARQIPGSGIDFRKFSPRADVKNDAKVFTFLFIGRLIKDKGIFEYINAASAIREKYPDVIFQVLGPFWSQNLKSNTITRNQLQSWIEEGIIHYQGEKNDIRPDLANADCIVLPSYREGTSNILLEAASMEKPVITCNTTGCREVVDDGITGFLCKVKDAQDLAAKMEDMLLLPEDERIAMGKKGRQKVIREFDKEIVLNSYMEVIEEII